MYRSMSSPALIRKADQKGPAEIHEEIRRAQQTDEFAVGNGQVGEGAQAPGQVTVEGADELLAEHAEQVRRWNQILDTDFASETAVLGFTTAVGPDGFNFLLHYRWPF